MMQWMYRSFRMSALLCCFTGVIVGCEGCGHNDDNTSPSVALQSTDSAQRSDDDRDDGAEEQMNRFDGLMRPFPKRDGGKKPPKDASDDDRDASECDAGSDSGYDAGVDSGGVVDAGVDAGSDAGVEVDSGYDAGAVVDAGQDSGSVVDASVDADVDAGSDAGAPPPISCSGWTRNTAFDSLLMNGQQIRVVGTPWGLSDNDIYVPIAQLVGPMMLAHWDGSLWTTTAMPGTPSIDHMNIWGSSASDIWAIGYDRGTGDSYIAHNTAGVWVLDPNVPSTYGLTAMWGLGPDTLYIAGNDSANGYLRIWKRSGSSWVMQTLPALPDPAIGPWNMWGDSPSRIFVSATQYSNTGVKIAAHILGYDGVSWKLMSTTPTELVHIESVSSSSATDTFVVGTKNNGNYALYRVSGSGLTSWMLLAESSTVSFGSVVSPSIGNAIVAAANISTLAMAGDGRIVLVQSGVVAAPIAIDALATWGALWHVPSTSSYYYVHGSSFNGLAGFYKGTCN